jgi:hypothetical protein
MLYCTPCSTSPSPRTVDGSVKSVTVTPSKELSPLDVIVGRMIQGSTLPLSKLLDIITKALSDIWAEQHLASAAPSSVVVSTLVQRLAERTSYGIKARGCIANEDTTKAGVWRWEVVNSGVIPSDELQFVQIDRRLLKLISQQVKGQEALIVLLRAHREEAKIAEQIDRIGKALRQVRHWRTLG